jgi:hypothetical protein
MTEESAQQGEAALWAAYDAVQCPVLLVRGSESDLLTRETAQQMTNAWPTRTISGVARHWACAYVYA